MAKVIEGRILGSELGEMEGFSYGTIVIQTADGRMTLRVTKETEGIVPRLDSAVRIEYEGDTSFRVLIIETLVEAEKKEGILKELPRVPFVWPKACASCGVEETLTSYSYHHVTKETTGFTRQRGFTYLEEVTFYTLSITGYLCDNCRVATEEMNKRARSFIRIVAFVAIVCGFIIPFIPGLADFQWWNPQIYSYLPPLGVSIFYIIVVGIPVLIYTMYKKTFEKPLLEYVRIYTGLDPTDYKLFLASPEYREKFIAVNGADCVIPSVGLRRFNFDPIMLCAGISCFGLFLPIIAAIIYHLIMG